MKYRIEGASKFMTAPNGNEICVEATGCEMFLWAEREKMIAALKTVSEYDPKGAMCGNNPADCRLRCIGCVARAALAEAEGEIREAK